MDLEILNLLGDFGVAGVFGYAVFILWRHLVRSQDIQLTSIQEDKQKTIEYLTLQLTERKSDYEREVLQLHERYYKKIQEKEAEINVLRKELDAIFRKLANLSNGNR